jgi:hypothetical protein
MGDVFKLINNTRRQLQAHAVWSLAFGIVLLTETVAGLAVAQVTGSAPPSGILATPLPAPVSVPSSGSLAALDRGIADARPLTAVRRQVIGKRVSLGQRRRRIDRVRPTILPATPVNEHPPGSISTTSGPEPDSVGSEIFFRSFGKAKE